MLRGALAAIVATLAFLPLYAARPLRKRAVGMVYAVFAGKIATTVVACRNPDRGPVSLTLEAFDDDGKPFAAREGSTQQLNLGVGQQGELRLSSDSSRLLTGWALVSSSGNPDCKEVMRSHESGKPEASASGAVTPIRRRQEYVSFPLSSMPDRTFGFIYEPF
jgi:hypothetical protein